MNAFSFCLLAFQLHVASAFVTVVPSPPLSVSASSATHTRQLQLQSTAQAEAATELPDSLQDAAERAAQATAEFVEQSGPLARCRVDFDTSVGDETYTLLKSSTEFMQNFVSASSLAMIPGLQLELQNEMTAVAEAKAQLRVFAEEKSEEELNADPKVKELAQVIELEGRAADFKWSGPLCRVYFPDEGSAALARRDWTDRVPPCVTFSSCGGVQTTDITRDSLVFFFCPKASESEYVEKILAKHESEEFNENLKMTCFVNPNLVDMGVTGFGMAGRLLRERLIEPLQYTYYLRTLQWGALTRIWPLAYTVWQEDTGAAGGYRLIKTLDRLPSNPDVEDIYDIENGNMSERKSGGVLDQLGTFVQGMMSL
eukprot:CAMPEP_0198147770 /NCGR_PEP_ID=MMETSP1443-20131203/37653_1 /TAXON_ID=186043 /ORGANISM="Entomoneis sp., Strain CCMP2396" /LENGTH=369 /DNA_ID=CAMNT_0043812235 /DNA_START=66 /DNA_END=1175 /DNA_ORIENTATION=+